MEPNALPFGSIDGIGALGGLGYVGIVAPDPAAWGAFATKICGLTPALIPPGPRQHGIPIPAPDAAGVSADGTVYLKMDRRQWRLAVHPGHRLELFSAPIIDQPFRSAHDIEFLTGELGMGHVVLYVPEIEPALAFYRDVLGFKRTDYMHFGPDGMGIHFLRCTRRHHSVALLQVGDLSGLQHLMIEATSLDGVGKALDRAIAAGVQITSNLGRHRNDKTVSFYMKGPSGFDIEIGWDGVLVGPEWVEHEFAGGGDDWGHHGLDADSLMPEEGSG